MDSDEPDRGQRFAKKFGEVLECLFEAEGLFPYALLLLLLGFGVYLVAGMTYHLISTPTQWMWPADWICFRLTRTSGLRAPNAECATTQSHYCNFAYSALACL
jgi:hypothetical protein